MPGFSVGFTGADPNIGLPRGMGLDDAPKIGLAGGGVGTKGFEFELRDTDLSFW